VASIDAVISINNLTVTVTRRLFESVDYRSGRAWPHRIRWGSSQDFLG